MNTKAHKKELTLSRKATRQAKRQHLAPIVECGSYSKKSKIGEYNQRGVRT